MAMVFPNRPTGNAWQLIGNSFNQGAGIVDQFGQNQNALQALVERRTQAALEQKRLEREQAMKEWEFEQKKAGEKRASNAAEFAKGVSPTLQADPSLGVSSKRPTGPSRSEIDALTLNEDRVMPSQQVGAGDSTALMGEALDRMQLANPDPGVRPSREAIIQNMTENRLHDEAVKYATATKPEAESYKWNNDPILLNDYQTKAQNDPTFQKIAEGYAKDPKRYGPMLQRWGNINGYSGQLWWNQEVDNMVKQNPNDRPMSEYQRAMLGFTKDKAEERKDLSTSAIDKLTALADKRDNVAFIVNSFKDNFSGPGTWTQNKLGKIVGTNEDQVVWWQNYQNFINQVRHGTFGASLTPHEKSEFEKSIATESTNPEITKRYVSRQYQIIEDAINRQADVYSAGKKVNQEQVKAALRPVEQPTRRPQPNNVSGPPIGTIKSGFKFKGGNPNDKNNWVKL